MEDGGNHKKEQWGTGGGQERKEIVHYGYIDSVQGREVQQKCTCFCILREQQKRIPTLAEWSPRNKKKAADHKFSQKMIVATSGFESGLGIKISSRKVHKGERKRKELGLYYKKSTWGGGYEGRVKDVVGTSEGTISQETKRTTSVSKGRGDGEMKKKKG